MSTDSDKDQVITDLTFKLTQMQMKLAAMEKKLAAAEGREPDYAEACGTVNLTPLPR